VLNNHHPQFGASAVGVWLKYRVSLPSFLFLYTHQVIQYHAHAEDNKKQAGPYRNPIRRLKFDECGMGGNQKRHLQTELQKQLTVQ
jgi:hypothetical protein